MQRTGSDPTSVHVKFPVDKVSLRQLSLSVLPLPCHYHFTNTTNAFFRTSLTFYNISNWQRILIKCVKRQRSRGMAGWRQMHWGRKDIGWRAERLSAFIFPVTQTHDVSLKESTYMLIISAASNTATMEDEIFVAKSAISWRQCCTMCALCSVTQ